MDPERFRASQPIERPPTDPLAHLQPAPPHSYKKNGKKGSSKWLISILLLIAIILIGGGVFALISPKSPSVKPKATHKQVVIQTKIKTPTPKPTPSIPSSTHTSASYGVTFSYPTSWTVIDSGSAPLYVTSPVMSLTAANGKLVSGQIQMTMAKQGSIPPTFGTNSVAVLSSQKITFNSPTPNQAADTYISFVQYPSTTTVGGLNGIYVSGNYGYQKYQVIPSSNIATVSPFIDFTFFSCASSICPSNTRQPLTISSTEWSNSSFSAPILLILKSLSFS